MKKSADAFRSIGEVAKLIGVAPHVLRYWETQFSQLKPMKRPDGRRYYRPEDVALAAGLCDVLRDDGLTIRGAKKLIARDRGETVRVRGLERLSGVVADTEAVERTVPVVETDTSVSPPIEKIVAPEAAQPIPSEPLANEEPEIAAPPEKPRVSKPQSGKAPHHKLPSGKPGPRKTAPSLPLFPDLSTHPDKRHGAWLSHLVRIATQLRQTEQVSGPTNRQCRILRDAISRHY